MALMHGLRLSVLNEIFCKNASDSFVGLFPYPDTEPVWAFMDNGENNKKNMEPDLNGSSWCSIKTKSIPT
jgi:hypothetical protein